MPIVRNSPKDCFDFFRSHVAKLIKDTLFTNEIVMVQKVRGDESKGVLSLGRPDQRSVPLESQTHGKVYVYLAQQLRAVPHERGTFRLTTEQYNYNLFDREPGPADEPLFRWEYVAKPNAATDKWCRHHFHFHVGKVLEGEPRRPIVLPLSKGTVDLNRLHVPTGFVLIEHVIRFLINDLSVRGVEGWEQALMNSENRFFQEFSPKTSQSPPA